MNTTGCGNFCRVVLGVLKPLPQLVLTYTTPSPPGSKWSIRCHLVVCPSWVFIFVWLRERKACVVRVYVRCLWNLGSFPKMRGLGKTMEGVTTMEPSWGTPFVGPKHDSEELFWIETCEKKNLLFFFKTIDNHFHARWIWSAVVTSVDCFGGFEATSTTWLNIHYSLTTRVQVKHPMPSCCLSIMSFYFCLVEGTQGLCCEGLC